MAEFQRQFFSCVDSRIEDNGTMYARFHLGTFFRGQALTFANALRRTLLSEIPALIITKVIIQNVNHEFATLTGVKEPILDIILNIKQLVFTCSNPAENFLTTPVKKFSAQLHSQGPGLVTAHDIKLPPNLTCISPTYHIATLSTFGELKIDFSLDVIDPILTTSDTLSELTLENKQGTKDFDSFVDFSGKRVFNLEPVSNSVRKVNYIISDMDSKIGSQYIALEIRTDGSIQPKHILQFTLKKLTKMFYDFADLSKDGIHTNL
jgi:DNA-directed RNA polymerase subunit alpha